MTAKACSTSCSDGERHEHVPPVPAPGFRPVARDRLQILLAHERAACGQSDLLEFLREEIMAVIAKHVTVEHDNVVVRMDRGATISKLEIDHRNFDFGREHPACQQTGDVCSYGGEAIGQVEP